MFTILCNAPVPWMRPWWLLSCWPLKMIEISRWQCNGTRTYLPANFCTYPVWQKVTNTVGGVLHTETCTYIVFMLRQFWGGKSHSEGSHTRVVHVIVACSLALFCIFSALPNWLCVCAMCSSLVSYGVKGGNSTSLGRSLTSNTCDRGGDFWAYHVIDYVVQKSNTFQLQRPFFSFNMSKADQEEGSRFWDWKLLLYSTSQLQCFHSKPLPKPISGHGKACPFRHSRHLFCSSCRRTHISPFHMPWLAF